LKAGASQSRAGVYCTRQYWGVGTVAGGVAAWQETSASPINIK
jgi:hypothetical protein